MLTCLLPALFFLLFSPLSLTLTHVVQIDDARNNEDGSNMAAASITDVSISLATLEDVFLNLSRAELEEVRIILFFACLLPSGWCCFFGRSSHSAFASLALFPFFSLFHSSLPHPLFPPNRVSVVMRLQLTLWTRKEIVFVFHPPLLVVLDRQEEIVRQQWVMQRLVVLFGHSSQHCPTRQ